MRRPRALNYQARARCVGLLRWTCPVCEESNRGCLRHELSWRISCTHCGSKYQVSVRLWQLPVGRAQRVTPTAAIRFSGTLYILCPACGSVQAKRMVNGRSWKIRCGYNRCRAAFAVGFGLWQIPAGRSEPALPVDPFPIVEVSFLEGRYLHENVLIGRTAGAELHQHFCL